MTLPIEVVTGREQPSSLYSPSEITLYGVPLVALEAFIGKTTQVVTVPVEVNLIPVCTPQFQFYAALISAYAYQSHCYNLPEPTVLLVQGDLVQAVGFGFDQMDYSVNPPINRTPYYMWRFDKLDRTMQLEMTSDTFEEIVLKRGLAGIKQPISYASRALIGHRGGKLTE